MAVDPRRAAVAGLAAVAAATPELCWPGLRDRGLSLTCVRVMAVILAEQAGQGVCRISQGEIAHRLGCHPGSIGPILRRLERAGVLHRAAGVGRIPDTLAPDVDRLALYACTDQVADMIEAMLQ